MAIPVDPILQCMRDSLEDQAIVASTPTSKWKPDPPFFLWKHCKKCQTRMPYWFVNGQVIATVGDYITYIKRWKKKPAARKPAAKVARKGNQ
jgi:hypothetical protein